MQSKTYTEAHYSGLDDFQSQRSLHSRLIFTCDTILTYSTKLSCRQFPSYLKEISSRCTLDLVSTM
ncbi:hypothetical protein AR158_c782L [Paramecium bursaria Chlorella virus AR158]|uniref:hypothetical protein n=1 Tax=Paramecium bursaria Chlorella virus AR158 TaxID=380598 RepID=UPI00015AA8F9|nr:hypothetical protein AR158_c782L [Paramecium bursaria Chlorella virus AR158]ABU44327.1 hypothetical protein AR158_c782L [Paramecium bursaria Chlorella virus AR158]